jgi:membrane protein DedA with SNARE-associated domain
MGLLPWAVYALGQWIWPPLAAPLAAVVFALVAWRAKIRWNALDAGVFAYFVILTIINLAGGQDLLPPRAKFALCPAVLAVAALLSVLLRRPFTLPYARQYAPAQVQARPAFFLSNQLITLIWVAGFASAAAIIGFGPSNGTASQPAIILITVLGITAAASAVLGIYFHFRESRLIT